MGGFASERGSLQLGWECLQLQKGFPEENPPKITLPCSSNCEHFRLAKPKLGDGIMD